jgi:hypothetical protein
MSPRGAAERTLVPSPPPRALRAWLLVAEARKEDSAAGPEDRPESLDVALASSLEKTWKRPLSITVANTERFVRSIREECLDRLILFGERRLFRALDEFVAHYHGERNHQGLGNELIDPAAAVAGATRVRCRDRLGGLLRYYHRAA